MMDCMGWVTLGEHDLRFQPFVAVVRAARRTSLTENIMGKDVKILYSKLVTFIQIDDDIWTCLAHFI